MWLEWLLCRTGRRGSRCDTWTIPKSLRTPPPFRFPDELPTANFAVEALAP